MTAFELSALAIGFLGSFHCVAMCGPIALALSGGDERNLSYVAGRSIYNSGRILTYAILGIAAGFLGHTFLLAGYQKSISITIGVMMIIGVVFTYWLGKTTRVDSFATRLNAFIKKVFSDVLKKRTKSSLFAAGLANGILPCGFVYIALAGAAATQHPVNGAAYMALFGLGTFPAMMAVSLFGKVAGARARAVLVKAAPALMICLGLLLIYRGVTMKNNSCCHHQTNLTEMQR